MVMAAQLFPLLGEQSTTKESVIRILSQEWPLTTKEIYRKISKENNKAISYQAVHKALNQLSDQHILSKQNQAYQLNAHWINQIKNFGQTIDHVYSNESGKLNLPNDFSKPYTIEFKDVSAYPVTMGNILISKTLTNGETKPVYALLQHGLWPLRFNFLDYEVLLRCAKANPVHGVITSNLPFDQWIAEQYITGGFTTVKVGIKPKKLEGNFIIHGETVMEVEYPPETLQFIEEIYAKMNSLSDLFKFYISRKISKHPYKAIVTIQKNPTLAKILTNQILELLE